MRDLILLIENMTALGLALTEIAEYIIHNGHGDLIKAAQVLKAHGYQEPMNTGHYYRGLMHDVTEQDVSTFGTVGALFEHLQQEVRFDMGRGPQGFTTRA